MRIILAASLLFMAGCATDGNWQRNFAQGFAQNYYGYHPPTSHQNYYNHNPEPMEEPYQLRYNPMNNTYQYAPANARLRYNGVDGNWQYAAPNARLRYNPFTGLSEFAP